MKTSINNSNMGFVFKSIRQLEKGQSKRTNGDTILFFVLCSVLVLFLPLIALLLKTNMFENNVRINGTFSLSTLLLLFSSVALRQANKAKLSDHYKKLNYYLLLSLLLGMGFLAFQSLAWVKLYQSLNPKYATILIVVVIVHAVHFIVAIGILLRFFIRTLSVRSAADVFIFFLNHKNEQLFKNTRTYWDFLGILWLALYVIVLLKFI